MSSWTVPGYITEHQLGHGASGRVVAAISEATGQPVAIKYLSPRLFRDPAFLAAFRAEARLLMAIDVPQVVRLFDYVEEPGQGAAIVMELVDGASLHEVISRHGATIPESALAVLKGSLLGLAAAHALGIVHRDYKPENVLVDADGNSKLSDFGVAVSRGSRAPAAGTPLYMAPEQWLGEPASPATDIYAATAVFFECLTGKTPFSGRISRLREQHEAAPVPLDQVEEPLRDLVARGMAKDPAARPPNAIAFVAELEETASAAYGPDWEERGRDALAALLLLLIGGVGGATGGDAAATWFGRRRVAVVGAAAAVIVVVIAVTAAALAITHGSSSHQPNRDGPSASATAASSTAAPGNPPPPPPPPVAVTAEVSVMPPGAVSSCAAPTPFTYSAKITASAPDTVSYRWVYSSGKEGQVQNLPFSAPGSKQVSSVVQAQAPGGWAAIQLIHPRQPLSNKVPYTLLCHKTGSWVIVATAAAHLAAGSVTCGTPPPPVTFTGTIESPRAAQVTYYWALSNGYHTPSAPLTFSVPGTKAVPPYRFTPPDDKATGDATLVVTSPVPAASSPAPYALTCKSQPPPPGLILKATASVSPQTATIGCFATQPAFTFSGTIYASRPTTVYYYWVLPDGTVSATYPLKFTQAGTQNVTPDPYTPDATSATGSGYFHIASPIYSTPNSNLATFTLSCTQPTFTLSTPTSAPPTPDSVQCGSTPPTFTVTSTITSDQNVMADYQWVRSDGSVNPAQPEPIQLTAGDPHQVTDDVTATSDSKYGVTDTLKLTSPVTKDSNPITLSVSCKYPPLMITTPTSGGGAPPVGAINIGYPAFSFGASGGDGSPLKWVSPPSTEPGSFNELPPGLSINPASGAITGTPTGSCDALAYCTYTFAVDVSDDNSALSATGTYSINVYPALTITTPVSGGGAPPVGVVDIGYPAFSFEASFGVQGDQSALTWAWTQTLAPPGLTLTPSGAITGTPTTAGTYKVPVTVTNGDDTDQTATQNYTITINPPLSIDPPPAGVTEGVGILPSGTWETPYSFMFTAAGGEGPYTWTATATESQTGPPPGLSIGPGDDTLSGTPTLPATSVLVPSAVAEGTTYTFTVTVTDSEPTPVSVPMTFEITIEPATSDLAILHAGRPSRKITVQVQADKAAEPVGQLYPPHPSSVADLIPAPGLKRAVIVGYGKGAG